MIKITKLVQTCEACPSQWDGLTDDNRAVYIRFRWGQLSICLGKQNDTSEFAALEGETIYCEQISDGLDGILATKEMKEITKSLIDWTSLMPRKI